MLLLAQGNEMLEFSVEEEVEAQEQWNSSSGSTWSITKICVSRSTDLNISYQGNRSLEEAIERAYQIVCTWINLSDLYLRADTKFKARTMQSCWKIKG